MPDSKNFQMRQHGFWESVAFAAALLPAVVYILALLRYTVDAPVGDDYDAILGWLLDFLSLGNIWDRLGALLQSHNEHRILIDRLATLINYAVMGRVSFYFLDLVGLTGLLASAAVFYKESKCLGLRLYEWVPVSVLLFNLRQWELISFAMASIQQYWQFFFCLVAIAYMRRDRVRSYVLSFAAAVLASFSGAGGLLLFPLGVFALILERKWRILPWWIGGGALVFCVYFAILPYRGSPVSEASHAVALHNPEMVLEYFLAFLGSYCRDAALGITAGLIALSIAAMFFLADLWGAYRNNRHGSSFFLLFIIFVIMTAASAAVSRISMGLDESLSSRYTIYSLGFLGALYVLCIEKAKSLRMRSCVLVLGIGASLALFFAFYSSSIDFLKFKRDLAIRYIVYPYNARAIDVLARSMRGGIYTPNAIVFSNLPHEARLGIDYVYPVQYSLSTTIPVPRNLQELVSGNESMRVAWASLSKHYLSSWDLKLAFPLNTSDSYRSLLHWASQASYFPEQQRRIFERLAEM